MFPTPTATSYGNNQGGQNPDGPVRHSLQSMARHNLWPTPDARCWKSGKGRKPNGHTPQLEAVAVPGGGLLNPAWVEWLMAFPLGWTDCARSATRRFRSWLRQHSAS